MASTHRARMIAQELLAPVTAAGERRVRTPEGAKKFGQPIGTVIRKDVAGRSQRMKARIGIVDRMEISAYPDHERTPDGRVILSDDELSEFIAPNKVGHSMTKYVEEAEDANGRKVKVLSKKREALHDELVRRSVERVRPPRGKKRAIYLGGGSGAGKGTATKQVPGYPRVRELDKYGSEPPGEAVLIDADAFKMALPEWGQPDQKRTAGFTHEESSLIAVRTRKAAERAGLEYVVDGTGDGSPKKMGGKIQGSKNEGYEVDAIYVTVPTEEAIVRVVTRGMETGRVIDLDSVTHIHASVSGVADAISGSYDHFSLYDADVPIGTVPPVIVSDGKVVDQEKYRAFMDKADLKDPVKAVKMAIKHAKTREFPRPQKPPVPARPEIVLVTFDGRELTAEELRIEVLRNLEEALVDLTSP